MAITIKPAHEIGDDEILRLSNDNPGLQFERDRDGRLIVTPTGGEGGRRSGEVFAQLYNWARAGNFGPVFDSSTGFHLPDGSVRSPDASWASEEQWRSFRDSNDSFPPVCPDVVFELRSNSDSMEQLREKMRAYAANGCKLGVLIDADAKSIELYLPGAAAEQHDYVAITLSELPGFTLNPNELD